MIKIIKYGCEFNIPKKSVVKMDATYDGIIVTLNDSTEVRFSLAVSPQVKAILPIIKNTPAEVVVFNLDCAVNGQYDKVLTLSSKVEPIQQVISVPQIVKTETEKKEIKKTTGKKIGRPKKTTK